MYQILQAVNKLEKHVFVAYDNKLTSHSILKKSPWNF